MDTPPNAGKVSVPELIVPTVGADKIPEGFVKILALDGFCGRTQPSEEPSDVEGRGIEEAAAPIESCAGWWLAFLLLFLRPPLWDLTKTQSSLSCLQFLHTWMPSHLILRSLQLRQARRETVRTGRVFGVRAFVGLSIVDEAAAYDML